MPTNWESIPHREQAALVSDFMNNVELVKLGLLSEDTLDLSFLSAMDPRAIASVGRPGARPKAAHFPAPPPFALHDLDAVFDVVFGKTGEVFHY